MKLKILAFAILLTPIWVATSTQTRESEPSRHLETVHPQKAISSDRLNFKNARFGRIVRDERGNVSFIPTLQIPLRQGETYGWFIRLKNPPDRVTWREELQLPVAPKYWSTDNGQSSEGISISKDRTKATTIRTVAPEQGVIWNAWSVAPGDPAGEYKLDIYINGSLAASFQFQLVPNIQGNNKSKLSAVADLCR